jgi:protein ImuB
VFAVIYIHNFSLQSVLRHEPELIPKPVVLTDPALTKPCVTQLTPSARACGICQGMTPSQAMARCGSLVVKTRSLSQEQTAMEALMQTAYAFSPHIEATAPDVCTIELKGLDMVGRASSGSVRQASPRLVGRASLRADEPFRQWAAEILRVLKQFHLNGQIGFAETPALALLAAHAACPVLVAQNEKGRARLEAPARAPHRAAQRMPDNDFIDSLPIEALDLPFESLEILKRWGINTAGAFLALGKDQLAERLGPAIVEIFDRLSTQSIRPLKIASPPETFIEEIEFENEIETLEPLLFILRRFVEQLSRRIELLYFVVAELHLKLGLTSGATYERAFTIPSPTGNVETLFRVLHTHLENLRTDASIATLRLLAKPGRPESHQFGLFETTLRNPNQFAETLARLTALCGSDRVGTPVVEATYRPDTFQMKPPDFKTGLDRTFHTPTKTPSICSNRRKEALIHNPKGIASFSPGLPSLRGYPGLEASNIHNPERVEPSARRPRVHRKLQRSSNAHWDHEPSIPQNVNECAPSPWGEGQGEGCHDLILQPAIERNQFSRGLTMRRFRPPIPAHIEIRGCRPVLMRSAIFNGVITDVRGPFFSSGNWWENNRWWREEWDIQTADGNLYRIFRPVEDGETVGRSCPVRVPPARAARPVRVAPRTVENAEPCPGGTPDNSPGFQAWVHVQPKSPSPEGTAESDIEDSQNLRQVLECGSPMPLSSDGHEYTQSFELFATDSEKFSLTPCFSGVYERSKVDINCFNSFPADSASPSYPNPVFLQFFLEGIYD